MCSGVRVCSCVCVCVVCCACKRETTSVCPEPESATRHREVKSAAARRIDGGAERSSLRERTSLPLFLLSFPHSIVSVSLTALRSALRLPVTLPPSLPQVSSHSLSPALSLSLTSEGNLRHVEHFMDPPPHCKHNHNNSGSRRPPHH